MSDATCHLEEQVARALRSESWPAGLRDHADGCDVCSELILVTRAMQGHAAELLTSGDLPDPRSIWWRAALARRQQACERATLAIRLVQRLAAVIAVVTGLAGAVWAWPRVTPWFSRALPSAPLAPDLGGWAQPVLVTVASACLLVLLVFFDFFNRAVED